MRSKSGWLTGSSQPPKITWSQLRASSRDNPHAFVWSIVTVDELLNAAHAEGESANRIDATIKALDPWRDISILP